MQTTAAAPNARTGLAREAVAPDGPSNLTPISEYLEPGNPDPIRQPDVRRDILQNKLPVRHARKLCRGTRRCIASGIRTIKSGCKKVIRPLIHPFGKHRHKRNKCREMRKRNWKCCQYPETYSRGSLTQTATLRGGSFESDNDADQSDDERTPNSILEDFRNTTKPANPVARTILFQLTFLSWLAFRFGKISSYVRSFIVPALMRYEGDLVILGGFRGSFLRDANTHKILWITAKASGNLRKYDLSLPLGPDGEKVAKERVIPDKYVRTISWKIPGIAAVWKCCLLA